MRASVLYAEAGSEGVVAMERGRVLGDELTGLSKADPAEARRGAVDAPGLLAFQVVVMFCLLLLRS